MLPIPHDPWLVLLSVAIAVQGSFVGLSLATQIDTATGLRRKLALSGAALTLATGVWSMHFVGMLAASFPSAVDYLALPTLLSFLICVLVVGCGVYFARASARPPLRIGLGALGMGLGVCLMHYVGVSAVHLAGPIHEAWPFIVLSLIVSVVACGFALWAMGARPGRTGLFVGALALGLAISGMHYTAMAGMRLDPICFDTSRFVEASASLSRSALAMLATVIAFGVSAAFLLSLVPDVGAQTSALRPALAVAFDGPAPLQTVLVSPEPAPAPLATLRVEKDGLAREIPVHRVVAVRANAHYTYIHDGEHEYFCGQSISALESRLAPSGFMRVHRSHLVRLSAVARLRRQGEAATLELKSVVQRTIPVARGQSRELRRRLESGAGPPLGEMRQQG